MKSCVIERPSETQLDLHCLPISMLLEDDCFATVPVIAVRPARTMQSKVEEEVYSLFEEAISERVAAVSRQLSYLPRLTTSGSLPVLEARPRDSETRLATFAARVRRFWQSRRRVIALLCLGLNLLLLGFDCMGLLILAR